METAESKPKSGYRFPQWNFRYVMILAILMKGCNLIDATLNITPHDTDVRINDSTYFNCSTSLIADKVQWRHGNLYVYTGIAILEPYNDGRFLVEINASTGASNLVIRSVQPGDAGAYECVEDEGLGEQGRAELMVLDGDPVCKSIYLHGFIGPNSCGIEPEEVRLSCSIKYHGNSLPVLQWKASDDNQSFSDGRINITSINNEVTYMLTMKSSLALDNASFICQTTRTSDKQYSCSPGTIHILYVFDDNVTINMTMNDEVSCFANTSQLCRYKWKWFSDDDYTTESDDHILKPKKVGWHRCEATCSFGGKSCIVKPLYANVYSDEATNRQIDTNGQNRMLFVLLLVPVFAVIGVITYCWRKKHKDKRNVPREGKPLLNSYEDATRNTGEIALQPAKQQDSDELSSEFGEDRALKEKELSILNINHESLVDLLDLSDLLGRLCSSNVIDNKQIESISSKPTSYEKNEELLEILRECTLRDYRQTIECLHQSKQSDIAKILGEGGVVVRARANLGDDVENVSAIETEIVASITDILSDEWTSDYKNRVVGIVQKVIGAKTGQSIVLYFYCKTIDELRELQESLDSGKLKNSVDVWFNSLLYRSQILPVKALTVSHEEFKKMRTYFKVPENIALRAIHDFDPEQMNSGEKIEMTIVSKRRRDSKQISHVIALTLKTGDKMETIPPANIGDTDGWWLVKHLDNGNVGYIPRNCVVIEKDHTSSETTLNDLPPELLGAILEKSYLPWVLNFSPGQKDGDVIRALTSVVFCWFQQITTRRLKSRIWKRLEAFYEKTKRTTTIIRNNRNYFLENIQPNNEMVLPLNCITEEQKLFIQRQRSNRDKNAKLLYIAESFDEAKFSNFVKSLRQTNQNTVARIMENGGGVIKVRVRSRVANCLDVQQLHQNIEDYRNRSAPWSYQTDKLISELWEEDIKILNSQMNEHTVVVWMWCRSKEAVENLRHLYGSNRLKDILFGLANIRSSSPEIIEPIVINIDINQFKRSVAIRPMCINLIQEIGDEEVIGITKLRNEIYVCSYNNNYGSGKNDCLNKQFFRVFEDRNPVRLKRKIEELQILDIGNIASSEKDNCVYLSDDRSRCIWKMTREKDDKYKIIKWLTTEYNESMVSVSRNGHLLMEKLNESNMMIYGSDARLIRSIELPTDIGNPYHAAETSIGNFIIVHSMDGEKHGWPMGKGWGVFVLTELTSDGQTVVRRFVPSSEEQILGSPQYFVIDSDDQVFLADSGNKRAILFDSDLKWNRIFCSIEVEEDRRIASGWPMRMFFDEEKKHLIVGGYAIGGISVYSFSRK